MKAKKAMQAYLVLVAVIVTAISFDAGTVCADLNIPGTIRVGLSFGQSQANIFTLGGETGIRISICENSEYKDLLEVDSPAGIKVRRDEYYNITSSGEREINYVRAAKYEGEVLGPYHIQIGDIYPDIEAARRMQKRISSIAPSVFLAYEGGWRVWSQLYLDESECLNQIKVMQNETNDVAYSVVHPDRKRIQIIDNVSGQILLLLSSEEGIRVTPKEAQGRTASIQYKGKKYRGSILLQSFPDSNITVVNELTLEEYLYSVVPCEMPASWPMEALKAQAVASRSYAIAVMGKHNEYGMDLCSGVHCQSYNGLEKEESSTTEAVNATRGKVLTYNGSIATAYYHASSGGHTEDSGNLWGTVIEYIRGVDDKYSLGSPHDSWTLEMDKGTIREKLAKSSIDIGDIRDIRILEVTEYGRVTKLEIEGTKETRIFERERIRNILGTSTLKSIWYTLKTDADIFARGSLLEDPIPGRTSNMYLLSAAGKTKASSSLNRVIIRGMSGTKAYNAVPGKYIFEGRGYGHGLGMSQYGAKGMAEAGYNYVDILEHYYQGAKVQ